MNPIYLLLAFVSLSFAKTIVDLSLAGVDIAQPNSIPNSKIVARAFPRTRTNLGQETCVGDLRTTVDARRRRTITFKTVLTSAFCDNDIDFTARCQTIIPTGQGVLVHAGKCFDDEVCNQIQYKNYLGHQTSEVACTQKDTEDHELVWSTDSSSTGEDIHHCGPGLTAIHEEDKLSISVQFYGGSNGAGRQWVPHAWIQSNKRTGKIQEKRGVNGLFWEGATLLGESIQACFTRDSFDDATKAILDWVDG